MGMNNIVDNLIKKVEKTTDLVKSELGMETVDREFLEEKKTMARASFCITSGSQQINAAQLSTMYQRKDGTIFFNDNHNDTFVIIDYQWSGARFETQSSSATNLQGVEVTDGKMGKMTAGAVIGTVLFPGVGTAVGAAIGASGKKKKREQKRSVTRSVERQVEVMTPANLKLKNTETGDIVSISINCNSLIDSAIKGFNIQAEQSVAEISENTLASLQGIKALKELLDIDAITQEEYDQKKAQLLNK